MRVLLPHRSLIEPDKSRTMSRFLRDVAGSAAPGSGITVRRALCGASIGRHKVPFAPAAVPLTANAIGFVIPEGALSVSVASAFTPRATVGGSIRLETPGPPAGAAT